MVAGPEETPVTMPDAGPTVAVALAVLQVPPPPSVNVIVDPTHTFDGPDIAEGNGFTVTCFVAEQPVPKV
jgi:hypothetical protein